MTTYRLSPGGRWNLLSLLVGALAAWGFSLWLLADTVKFSYAHLPSTLGPAWTALTPGQKVPAYLLLALVLAGPLLIWNLLGELLASYTVDAAGLRFKTLGRSVSAEWAAVAEIKHLPAREGEPGRADVLVRRPGKGPARIPVYADVAGRAELLDAIRQQLAPASPEPLVAAAPAVDAQGGSSES